MIEVFELLNKSSDNAKKIDINKDLSELVNKGANREALNIFFYRKLRGVSVDRMKEICNEWFETNKSHVFNLPVLEEIIAHQNKSAKIVIVSGSFKECVIPIANYLRIEEIICTELEERNKMYTGRILKYPIIGEGKSKSILEYINNMKFSLEGSYVYGDHESDIEMLSLADHPVVVGSNMGLRRHAEKKRWKIINL